MRRIKSQKGITLIALIITIVILLILAVVTIRVVQEDGIIGKAKYARDEYERAQAKENSILQSYLELLNDNTLYGSGGTGNTENENIGNENNGDGSIDDEETGDGTSGDRVIITMEEAQDDNMLSKTSNSNVIDKYENPIIVPAGFKILVDETTGYTADTIDVTKGIVIQDAIGNEFVWVPVGDIYYSETEYKTINLDRYTFEEDGTPIPQGDVEIDRGYKEVVTSDLGNATAKDLQGFIDSATTKGGYYLARYEAGVENGKLDLTGYTYGYNEAPDINWTGYVPKEGNELQLVSKKDVQVWGYVTQNKASELSRNMYSGTTFTSDLVNSYAWDTAIVFIQTFSTEADANNYANLNKSTSFVNTGINTDNYCNIYDMSGNACEWTTESNTTTLDFEPCITRGGVYRYGSTNWKTSSRVQNENDICFNEGTFRIILYVQ